MHSTRKCLRGISEVLVAGILLALGVILGLLFIAFIHSSFTSQRELHSLEEVITREKSSTIVRLVEARSTDAVFLAKRIDKGDTIHFFVYTNNQYIDCSKVVYRVENGELVNSRLYSLRDVKVIDTSGISSFQVYARSMGLPDNGVVTVCSIRLRGNALITLATLTPIIQGYGYTYLTAQNGSWRVYGSLVFQLLENAKLVINETSTVTIPVNSIIRLDLNTTSGYIKLSNVSSYMVSVFADNVYINGALFCSKCSISLDAKSISLLQIFLVSDIILRQGGFAQVTYNGVTYTFIGPDYLRITNWMPSNTQDLVMNFGNSFEASGVIYAVYRGGFKPTIYIFIVTYIGDTPYIVDYYKFILENI